MRKGTKYFSYRKGNDYTYLSQAVNEVLDYMESDRPYIKKFGFACSRCDYFEQCHGEENFMVVLPEKISDGFELEDLPEEYQMMVTSIELPSQVISPTVEQKKLKLLAKYSRGEEPLFRYTGRINKVHIVPGSPNIIDVNKPEE